MRLFPLQQVPGAAGAAHAQAMAAPGEAAMRAAPAGAPVSLHAEIENENPVAARVLAAERRLFKLKTQLGMNAAGLPGSGKERAEVVNALRFYYVTRDFTEEIPAAETLLIGNASAAEQERAIVGLLASDYNWKSDDNYCRFLAKVQTQFAFMGAGAVEAVLWGLVKHPPRGSGANEAELWSAYLTTVRIGMEHLGFAADGTARLAAFSRGRHDFGSLVVEKILSDVLALEKGVEGRARESVLRLADVFVPWLSDAALVDLVTVLLSAPPSVADAEENSYYRYFLNKWLGRADLGRLFEKLSGKHDVRAGTALHILDYIEEFHGILPDGPVARIADNMTAFLAHENPKVRYRYRAAVSRLFAGLPGEKKGLALSSVMGRFAGMSPALRTEAGEFLKGLYAQLPRDSRPEVLFGLARLLADADAEFGGFARDLFDDLLDAAGDPAEALSGLAARFRPDEDALNAGLLELLRAQFSRIAEEAARETLARGVQASLGLELPEAEYATPEARLEAVAEALRVERAKLAFTRSGVMDAGKGEAARQDELDKTYSLIAGLLRGISPAFANAAYRRFRDEWAREGDFAGRFLLYAWYGLPPDLQALEDFLYTPHLPTYLKKTLRQPDLYASGSRADPAVSAAHYARVGFAKRTSGDLAGAKAAYRAALAFDVSHAPSLKALGEILEYEKAPAEETAAVKLAAYRADAANAKAFFDFAAALPEAVRLGLYLEAAASPATARGIEDKILSLCLLRGGRDGFDASAGRAFLVSARVSGRFPDIAFLADILPRLEDPARREGALADFRARREGDPESSRLKFFETWLAAKGFVADGTLGVAESRAMAREGDEIHPELTRIFSVSSDPKIQLEALWDFTHRADLRLSTADLLYLLKNMPRGVDWKKPGAWDDLKYAIRDGGGKDWGDYGTLVRPMDLNIAYHALRKTQIQSDAAALAGLSELVFAVVNRCEMFQDRHEDFKADVTRVFVREVSRVMTLAPQGESVPPRTDARLAAILADMKDPYAQIAELAHYAKTAESFSDQDLYLLLEKMPRGVDWGLKQGQRDLHEAMRASGLAVGIPNGWEAYDVSILFWVMRKVKAVTQPARLHASLVDIQAVVESCRNWGNPDSPNPWTHDFRVQLTRFFFNEHDRLMQLPVFGGKSQSRVLAAAQKYLDVLKADPSCALALAAIEELAREHELSKILAEARGLAVQEWMF